MREHTRHRPTRNTSRYRPELGRTTSVQHTWWGVTTPRSRTVAPRRSWGGVLVVAALAVAFPVWLWLLTDPAVLAAVVVATAAALAGQTLVRSRRHESAPQDHGPPTVGPPDY